MKSFNAILFTCTCLLFTVTCFSQSRYFQKSLGPTNFAGSNDISYSMYQTWDGGYIVCGSTGSYGAGSIDSYIAKFDTAGNQLWAKTYGTTNWEATWKLIITSDSGYVFAGSVIDPTFDILLIKTDQDGVLQWSKKYGGASAEAASTLESIEQTDDLGYIITGVTDGYDTIVSDNIFLIKTDVLGDTLWTRVFSAPDFDQSLSVHQTMDRGYIISGRTNSFGAGQIDALLIKTDSMGMITWTNAYGGIEGDEGMSVKQTADSGFVMTGASYSFGPGYPDIYTIKTNSIGDVQWSKIYDGGGVEASYCIIETPDGGYAITGFTESFLSPQRAIPGNPTPQGNDSANVILLKLNSAGDIQWSDIYGGHLLDEAYSLSMTQDGGYLLAAITRSFGSDTTDNGYIIHTDSAGFIDCYSKPVTMLTFNAPTITTPGIFSINSGISYSNYNLTEALFVLKDSLLPGCIPVSMFDDHQQPSSIKIYPNPVFDNCLITAKDFINAHLFLYDISGRIIYQQHFSEEQQINISSLARGIYFIEIKDKEGKSLKGKIVRN